MRTRIGLAIGAPAAALILSATPALGAARPYDFNGDGRQELVAGMPDWSDNSAPNAGALLVIRTDRHGLRRSAQLIDRSTPGVPGDPTDDSRLGVRVASGDLNGDGFADLVTSTDGTASLLVIYGSTRGLDPATSRSFGEQGVTYAAVAAGDVTGDGLSDLAVSVSGAGVRRIAIFRGT